MGHTNRRTPVVIGAILLGPVRKRCGPLPEEAPAGLPCIGGSSTRPHERDPVTICGRRKLVGERGETHVAGNPDAVDMRS